MSIEDVTSELDEEIGGRPSDREFVAMRAAYRAIRWHARGDDFAAYWGITDPVTS